MTMMNHKMMSTVRPPTQGKRSERIETVNVEVAVKVIRCNVPAPAAMKWVSRGNRSTNVSSDCHRPQFHEGAHVQIAWSRQCVG